MSDEVCKGRACSGIPKSVGRSLKREPVTALEVRQDSPRQRHNPEIGTIAGGNAQYARLRSIASEPAVRIERFVDWYFGILTLAESSAQIGRQMVDDNAEHYHSQIRVGCAMQAGMCVGELS
jgi:hypothetical protein